MDLYKKYSYLLQYDDKIAEERYIKAFKKRGNWEQYNWIEPIVNFSTMSVEMFYSKPYYRKIKSDISNHITPRITSYLYSSLKLYENIKKKHPDISKKYFLRLYSKNEIKKNMFNNNIIWVLRPEIWYFRKDKYKIKKFDEYKKIIKEKAPTFTEYEISKSRVHKYENWAIYKKINNQLTRYNKKYNIQIFCVLYKNKTFVCNGGNIKLEYFKKNKNVYKYKDFPEYISNLVSSKQIKTIKEKMYYIIYLINKIMGEKKCFLASKRCYKVVYFQFILTDKYDIIYTNSYLSTLYNTRKKMDNIIKNTLFECIIDKQFPPKNKIKNHPNEYFDIDKYFNKFPKL